MKKHRFVFAPLEELGRRMPQEAHLDAVRDAAGMRPDPGLVRAEDDPDLAGPIAGFSAGRAAFVQPPSMSGNERATVADPISNRLEMAPPRPPPGQGRRRRATAATEEGVCHRGLVDSRRVVGSDGSTSMHVASAKPRSAQVQAVPQLTVLARDSRKGWDWCPALPRPIGIISSRARRPGYTRRLSAGPLVPW